MRSPRTLAALGLTLALGLPAPAAVDLQLGPGAASLGSRKVHIAPAQVEFHRDFGASQSVRGHTPRLSPAEKERLAREMGDSFTAALREVLRARGFEVSASPGNDVVKLEPSLRDLQVHAVEGSTTAALRQYVREAGGATLRIEGTDASGRRVFVASEQRTTGRLETLSEASDVSNRFWFETMFRRYSEELVAALQDRRR